MRLKFVYNPSAGKGRTRGNARHVAEKLKSLSPGVETFESESADHLCDLVRRAADEEFDRVVVAGGDGTLHWAVNALDLERLSLAVIPLGTGDDLAKTLGIPTNVDAACENAVNGVERRIDVAVANGRRYLGVAGVGFDSKVASHANKVRFLSGSLVYLYSIFRVLPSFKPLPIVVSVDGHVKDEELMFAVIGNGSRYGGGIRIAPTAVLDDQLLDLVLVRRCTKWDLLTTLPKAYSGKHVESPFVGSMRGQRFRLESEEPLEVYADGEYVGFTPMNVELSPATLRIVVPKS